MHHVQDVHQWLTGICEHDPLTDGPTDSDGRQLQYFSQHEPAFKALQKLTMDVHWLKSKNITFSFGEQNMLFLFSLVLAILAGSNLFTM